MSGGVEGVAQYLYETIFSQSGGWARCSPENRAEWVRIAEHAASLTTPPARSYADGVEDAAKVAERWIGPKADISAGNLPAAIRLLSQEPQP